MKGGEEHQEAGTGSESGLPGIAPHSRGTGPFRGCQQTGAGEAVQGGAGEPRVFTGKARGGDRALSHRCTTHSGKAGWKPSEPPTSSRKH